MYCAPARIAMRAVSGSSTVPAPIRISPEAYSLARCLDHGGRAGNCEGDFNRSRASTSASLGDTRGLVCAIGSHDCDQSRFDDFS